MLRIIKALQTRLNLKILSWFTGFENGSLPFSFDLWIKSLLFLAGISELCLRLRMSWSRLFSQRFLIEYSSIWIAQFLKHNVSTWDWFTLLMNHRFSNSRASLYLCVITFGQSRLIVGHIDSSLGSVDWVIGLKSCWGLILFTQSCFSPRWLSVKCRLRSFLIACWSDITTRSTSASYVLWIRDYCYSCLLSWFTLLCRILIKLSYFLG